MAISGEGSYFTLIQCADNAEWLEQRKMGVGGSDVAAVMGLSPWKTPLQLWLEKTGRVEPNDISEKPYVAFGTIMEPIIKDWYSAKHPDYTVRRVNAICRAIKRPWALSSLDYEVNQGGVWGVLECKTARTADDWQDGVPAYYLTQVTHYLSVTGRTFADVAVFFRDSCEFHCYRVHRDEDDIKAVANAVDDFWLNYVQNDIMPKITGTDGDAAALATCYSDHTGEFVQVLDPRADELISQYQDAAAREKAAKADKTAAANKLMALIGDAKGIITDVAKVTWVRSEREQFDVKAFKDQFPNVYSSFATTERRNGGLRIKEL